MNGYGGHHDDPLRQMLQGVGAPEKGFCQRVYTDMQDVGKTVAASKKRVVWKFGFSESHAQFQVGGWFITPLHRFLEDY